MKNYQFKVGTKMGNEIIKVEGNPEDDSFLISSEEATSEYDVTYSDFEVPTTVIDIGAGYGEFALKCLKLGAQEVVCIEPNNKVFSYLKENLSEYKSKCQIINAAVIDYEGETELLFMESRTAAGSVLDVQYNPDSIRAKSRLRQKVKVIDINNLLKKSSCQKILLKIDAEGCEYRIIKRLLTSDYKNCINKIYTEYHMNICDIISDLESIGFISKSNHKEAEMGIITSDRKINNFEQNNKIFIQTFGFKYGHPRANYYFDVSFLKNPVRQSGAKLSDPYNDSMLNFVLQQPAATQIVNLIVNLILILQNENADTIIGIGCNSGRHRSRAIAELVSKELSIRNIPITILHRDLY